MKRTSAHRFLARVSPQAVPDVFAARGVAELIKAALSETGAWNKRKCPLNAVLVVWLVVAMGLYRGLSVPDVLKELLARLRGRFPRLSLKVITKEAPVKARKRLGSAPLKILFEKLACRVDPEPSFRDLRTWGADGVRLTVPDTAENDAAFGRPKASRGTSAFPQMLGVALVDTANRQIRDVVFGRHDAGERPGCISLLKHLGPNDVLLLDRGFPSIELFDACRAQETHFLARLSSIWKPTVLHRLGRGDSIVQVAGRILLPREQWQGWRGRYRKVVLTLRVIEYRIGRKKAARLITDLLDPRKYPALELVKLYHERWECELVYDEIKTHLVSTAGGTLDTTLRSKSAEGTRQEVYGMLVAYNLVRELMAEAARLHHLDPDQISFVETLHVIRIAARQMAQPGTRQQRLIGRQILDDIADCKIKRPRRKRSWPRVVKTKMKNFKLKRMHHREEPLDFAVLVRLGSLRRAA